ncbi:putative glycine-rich cell wall structural protein 1 isoform X2 [Acyrthosiphon pisum]|uniref:Uncharacterized protein n=1 Tax=Acyrthosiphon pisum TaxID=7029 RepID=A0A8R2NM57_ACYPI|nr:putative glycine-rich cell wall structural protein 1 isoform X1 [Acyrthosiphon pisum]XP_029343337.1 putative glycine-rich cell wall structural protein 1 isoform X2 [Acyrthosiphon pisum]
MSSRLFKSNVILLVLYIGMTFFHNSSQKNDGGVLSKIKAVLPSRCFSSPKGGKPKENVEEKHRNHRVNYPPTGGATSNSHSHSQDHDNGHNESGSDGGLGTAAAAGYVSSYDAGGYGHGGGGDSGGGGFGGGEGGGGGGGEG